jgi:hypothetical protein
MVEKIDDPLSRGLSGMLTQGPTDPFPMAIHGRENDSARRTLGSGYSLDRRDPTKAHWSHVPVRWCRTGGFEA